MDRHGRCHCDLQDPTEYLEALKKKYMERTAKLQNQQMELESKIMQMETFLGRNETSNDAAGCACSFKQVPKVFPGYGDRPERDVPVTPAADDKPVQCSFFQKMMDNARSILSIKCQCPSNQTSSGLTDAPTKDSEPSTETKTEPSALPNEETYTKSVTYTGELTDQSEISTTQPSCSCKKNKQKKQQVSLESSTQGQDTGDTSATCAWKKNPAAGKVCDCARCQCSSSVSKIEDLPNESPGDVPQPSEQPVIQDPGTNVEVQAIALTENKSVDFRQLKQTTNKAVTCCCTNKQCPNNPERLTCKARCSQRRDGQNQCAFVGSPLLVNTDFEQIPTQTSAVPIEDRKKSSKFTSDSQIPCTCGPEARNPAGISLLSLNSKDAVEMQTIADLVRKEKDIKQQIEVLHKREKAFQDASRNGDKLQPIPENPCCHCRQGANNFEAEITKVSQELRLENNILKSELMDLKMELKHCLEKVEGPMKQKLETEKLKCEQLQRELQSASKNMLINQDTYMREMNQLKMQLCCACNSISELNQMNTRLKDEMAQLDCLCTKLEDDLVKQKIDEAETIKRLTNRRPNKEPSSKQLEEFKCDSSLAVVARKLSKTIKELAPCDECSTLPPEVTGAAKCIKELTDLVLKRRNKQPKQHGCSCQRELPSRSFQEEDCCSCCAGDTGDTKAPSPEEKPVTTLLSVPATFVQKGTSSKFEMDPGGSSYYSARGAPIKSERSSSLRENKGTLTGEERPCSNIGEPCRKVKPEKDSIPRGIGPISESRGMETEEAKLERPCSIIGEPCQKAKDVSTQPPAAMETQGTTMTEKRSAGTFPCTDIGEPCQKPPVIDGDEIPTKQDKACKAPCSTVLIPVEDQKASLFLQPGDVTKPEEPEKTTETSPAMEPVSSGTEKAIEDVPGEKPTLTSQEQIGEPLEVKVKLEPEEAAEETDEGVGEKAETYGQDVKVKEEVPEESAKEEGADQELPPAIKDEAPVVEESALVALEDIEARVGGPVEEIPPDAPGDMEPLTQQQQPDEMLEGVGPKESVPTTGETMEEAEVVSGPVVSYEEASELPPPEKQSELMGEQAEAPPDLPEEVAGAPETQEQEVPETTAREVPFTEDRVGEFPYDVDTKAYAVDQPPSGLHLTTAITTSGNLEVVTEGPGGTIQTIMTYNDEGNIVVETQMVDYGAEGSPGPESSPEDDRKPPKPTMMPIDSSHISGPSGPETDTPYTPSSATADLTSQLNTSSSGVKGALDQTNDLTSFPVVAEEAVLPAGAEPLQASVGDTKPSGEKPPGEDAGEMSDEMALSEEPTATGMEIQSGEVFTPDQIVSEDEAILPLEAQPVLQADDQFVSPDIEAIPSEARSAGKSGDVPVVSEAPSELLEKVSSKVQGEALEGVPATMSVGKTISQKSSAIKDEILTAASVKADSSGVTTESIMEGGKVEEDATISTTPPRTIDCGCQSKDQKHQSCQCCECKEVGITTSGDKETITEQEETMGKQPASDLEDARDETDSEFVTISETTDYAAAQDIDTKKIGDTLEDFSTLTSSGKQRDWDVILDDQLLAKYPELKGKGSEERDEIIRKLGLSISALKQGVAPFGSIKEPSGDVIHLDALPEEPAIAVDGSLMSEHPELAGISSADQQKLLKELGYTASLPKKPSQQPSLEQASLQQHPELIGKSREEQAMMENMSSKRSAQSQKQQSVEQQMTVSQQLSSQKEIGVGESMTKKRSQLSEKASQRQENLLPPSGVVINESLLRKHPELVGKTAEEQQRIIQELGYAAPAQGQISIDDDMLQKHPELIGKSYEDQQQMLQQLGHAASGQGAIAIDDDMLQKHPELIGKSYEDQQQMLQQLGYAASGQGAIAIDDDMLQKHPELIGKSYEDQQRMLQQLGYAASGQGAIAIDDDMLQKHPELIGKSYEDQQRMLQQLGYAASGQGAIAIDDDMLQKHPELIGKSYEDQQQMLQELGYATSAQGGIAVDDDMLHKHPELIGKSYEDQQNILRGLGYTPSIPADQVDIQKRSKLDKKSGEAPVKDASVGKALPVISSAKYSQSGEGEVEDQEKIIQEVGYTAVTSIIDVAGRTVSQRQALLAQTVSSQKAMPTGTTDAGTVPKVPSAVEGDMENIIDGIVDQLSTICKAPCSHAGLDKERPPPEEVPISTCKAACRNASTKTDSALAPPDGVISVQKIQSDRGDISAQESVATSKTPSMKDAQDTIASQPSSILKSAESQASEKPSQQIQMAKSVSFQKAAVPEEAPVQAVPSVPEPPQTTEETPSEFVSPSKEEILPASAPAPEETMAEPLRTPEVKSSEPVQEVIQAQPMETASSLKKLPSSLSEPSRTTDEEKVSEPIREKPASLKDLATKDQSSGVLLESKSISIQEELVPTLEQRPSSREASVSCKAPCRTVATTDQVDSQYIDEAATQSESKCKSFSIQEKPPSRDDSASCKASCRTISVQSSRSKTDSKKKATECAATKTESTSSWSSDPKEKEKQKYKLGEVPSIVSEVSDKERPVVQPVKRSKPQRKKRSSSARVIDCVRCQCAEPCSCAVCFPDAPGRDNRSLRRQSRSCYCPPPNLPVDPLMPQVKSHGSHPTGCACSQCYCRPCTPCPPQYPSEYRSQYPPSANCLDVTAQGEFSEDEAVLKLKRHPSKCECVDCLCLPKIKQLAETRECPVVFEKKQVYQFKVNCNCSNAQNARKNQQPKSRIPISTSSPNPPKVKSESRQMAGSSRTGNQPGQLSQSGSVYNSIACDCEVCACAECPDTKKATPVTTPVTTPAEPVKSQTKTKDCCCPGPCTCEPCPIDVLTKKLRDAEAQLTTTLQQAAAKPPPAPDRGDEPCDCQVCTCPGAASMDKPGEDECTCKECVCPGAEKIGVKKSRSQPDRKAEEVLPTQKSQSETGPTTSSMGDEECTCPECVCPQADKMGKKPAAEGAGDEEWDCGVCACPGSTSLPKKDFKIPDCDCADCSCAPCADPKRETSKPKPPEAEAPVAASTTFSCDCSDCKCEPCTDPAKIRGILSAKTPSQMRPAASAKAVTIEQHPADCSCPICECGDGDGQLPEIKSEKVIAAHTESCVCATCKCPDEPPEAKESKGTDMTKKGDHPPDCDCPDCLCPGRDLPAQADIGIQPASDKAVHSLACVCPQCLCPECTATAAHAPGCRCVQCLCSPCDYQSAGDVPTKKSAVISQSIGTPPTGTDCSCIKCFCDVCSKATKQSRTGVPPSQSQHDSGCTCTDCLCTECAEKLQGMTHEDGCKCTECLCDDCLTKLQDIKPAPPIPGKPSTLRTTQSGPEKSSPGDRGVNCTCERCTCIDCKALDTPKPQPHPGVPLQEEQSTCKCPVCVCAPCKKSPGIPAIAAAASKQVSIKGSKLPSIKGSERVMSVKQLSSKTSKVSGHSSDCACPICQCPGAPSRDAGDLGGSPPVDPPPFEPPVRRICDGEKCDCTICVDKRGQSPGPVGSTAQKPAGTGAAQPMSAELADVDVPPFEVVTRIFCDCQRCDCTICSDKSGGPMMKSPSVHPSAQMGPQPSVQANVQMGTQPSVNYSAQVGTQPSVQATVPVGLQPSVLRSAQIGTQPSVQPTVQVGLQPSIVQGPQVGTQSVVPCGCQPCVCLQCVNKGPAAAGAVPAGGPELPCNCDVCSCRTCEGQTSTNQIVKTSTSVHDGQCTCQHCVCVECKGVGTERNVADFATSPKPSTTRAPEPQISAQPMSNKPSVKIIAPNDPMPKAPSAQITPSVHYSQQFPPQGSGRVDTVAGAPPSGQLPGTCEPCAAIQQASVLPDVQIAPQPSIHPSTQMVPQPSVHLSGQIAPQPSVHPSAQMVPQPSVHPSAQMVPPGSVHPSAQIIPPGSVHPSAQIGPPGSVHPSGQIVPPGSVHPSAQIVPPGSVHPSAQICPPGSVHPSAQIVPPGSVHPSTQIVPPGSVHPSMQMAPQPSVHPSTQIAMQPSIHPSAQAAVQGLPFIQGPPCYCPTNPPQIATTGTQAAFPMAPTGSVHMSVHPSAQMAAAAQVPTLPQIVVTSPSGQVSAPDVARAGAEPSVQIGNYNYAQQSSQNTVNINQPSNELGSKRSVAISKPSVRIVAPTEQATSVTGVLPSGLQVGTQACEVVGVSAQPSYHIEPVQQQSTQIASIHPSAQIGIQASCPVPVGTQIGSVHASAQQVPSLHPSAQQMRPPSVHPSAQMAVPGSVHASAQQVCPPSVHASAQIAVPGSVHPSAQQIRPPSVHPSAQMAVPGSVHASAQVCPPSVHASAQQVCPPSVHASAQIAVPGSVHPSAQQFRPPSVHPSAQMAVPGSVHASAQVCPPSVHASAQMVVPGSVHASAQQFRPPSMHPSAQIAAPGSVHASTQQVCPPSVHPSAQICVPGSVHASAQQIRPPSVHPSAQIAVPGSVHASAQQVCPPSVHPSTQVAVPGSVHPSAQQIRPPSVHPSAQIAVSGSVHPSAQQVCPVSTPASAQVIAPGGAPLAVQASGKISARQSALRPPQAPQVPCDCPECSCEEGLLNEVQLSTSPSAGVGTTSRISSKAAPQDTNQSADTLILPKPDIKRHMHPPQCDCPDCACAPCADPRRKGALPPGIGTNLSLKNMDADALKQNIDAIIKENQQCRNQISEIKQALDSIKCACTEAELRTQGPSKSTSSKAMKPFVKQAAAFGQTMSGLKMALKNLQSKCKAKDRMIEAMTTELELRQGPEVFDKILMMSQELSEVLDYDQGEDVKSTDRSQVATNILFGPTKAGGTTTSACGCGPDVQSKGVEVRTHKHKKKKEKADKLTCSCSKPQIVQKEDKDCQILDPTGFEVIDIRRITEDSLIVKWTKPKFDQIIGYDLFVNGTLASKVMSSVRTSAMMHSLDLSKTVQITVYAVTKCGRIEPPAIAIYEIDSKTQ
ncbi:uncharacterized protein LOC143204352 isoform X2 [Rhynchophorus ferrugineus]|uniref:uncharacterized protein LOC143204352 isoform X2 n=1 Tax=Rhynchophorus ferrugineus TaxID=354439 RepID=UPI003FCE182E